MGFGTTQFGTSPYGGTLDEIRQVNSTTYVDELGIQLGIDRLPGEDARDYLRRLDLAASLNRDHTSEGTLSQIALRLGLDLFSAINIQSSDSNAVMSCGVGGITLISNNVTNIVPLVRLDEDSYWQWYMLSDIVSAINSLGTIFTAKLLADDGPALQLANQTNVSYDTDQTKTITWPYDLVASDVGMISLVDPSLENVAISEDGNLAYQLKETIQSIMLTDRSYWAK